MPNPNSSGTGFLDVSSWLQMFGRKGWLGIHGPPAREHCRATPIPVPSPASWPQPVKFRSVFRSLSVAPSPKARARHSRSSCLPKAWAGTWKQLPSSPAPTSLKRKTLVTGPLPKANEMYNTGYAVVAMPGVAKPVEHFPPNLLEKMIDNDFRMGRQQPQGNSGRVAEALRFEVRAQGNATADEARPDLHGGRLNYGHVVLEQYRPPRRSTARAPAMAGSTKVLSADRPSDEEVR